ncbi:MAG: hypothetical protein WAT39_00085 [Planctomycetota bacterium]
MLCMLCGAATYRVTVDVLNWRASDESARAIVGDEKRTDDERINAVVVLVRNGRASIESLKKLAENPGRAGDHARNALRLIDEALR